MISVLMVGPSRKSNGGMTTVVNNYFQTDLPKKVKLKYIDTTIDGFILKVLTYNFLAYIKILYVLLFHKVDIIHIHMASRGSFYRKSIIVLIGKLFRKKVIIHLHGASFEKFYKDECNKRKKKYVKKIFSMADKVIVLSIEWKEKILEWFSCDITVIENSVFVPNINLYNNKSKNIVLLGRLNERKGTYDLIEVVQEIVDEFKDIKFLLAGDGDLVKVNSKINELGITEYVEVLGWIDKEQREAVLKNTLIYLLPSYNEGMPMSVIEAMSYGIPSISTFVGGIPQLIDNNINGFLIYPGNRNELRDSIKKLLINSNLRADMSNKAYEKIATHFNINSKIEDLLKIYIKISVK